MTAQGDDIFHWELPDGNVIGVNRFKIDDLLLLLSKFPEPVLQIGSKSSIIDNHGGKWRKIFSDKKFVGIDIEDGENVDFLHDISDNVSRLRKKTGIKQFSTIICSHILEHVKNPFVAADNLQKLLRPGGKIFVTVPWVQGFHGFPDDYWRMSFPAIRLLFEKLEIIDEYYSDAREEFGYRLNYNGKTEHSNRTCRIERNLFQFITDEMPEQRIFEDAEGIKIKLSKMYMPGMSVNLIMSK